MKSFTVEASALIQAAPSVVYGIVADYREGHQKILPKPYFISQTVSEGGFGAGTKIKFQMRVFGSTREFEAEIAEPEPGRILVETDLNGRAVTTFRVDPLDDGKASRASISTVATTERDGLLGIVERVMSRSFLKRVYEKELALLAKVATNSKSSPD